MYTSYNIHLAAVPYLDKYLTPKQFILFFRIISSLLDEDTKEDWSLGEEYEIANCLLPYNVLWTNYSTHTRESLSTMYGIKPSVFKKLEKLNIIGEYKFRINNILYTCVCINPYLLTTTEEYNLLPIFKPLDFSR